MYVRVSAPTPTLSFPLFYCVAWALLRAVFAVDLGAHQAVCDRLPVVCNVCGMWIPRHELPAHEQLACERDCPLGCGFRDVQAGLDGVRWGSLAWHRWWGARNLVALVTTRPGVLTPVVLDRGQHMRTDCPEARVPCPLAAMGCAERVQLKAMDAHLAGSLARHFHLLMTAHAGLTTRFERSLVCFAALRSGSPTGLLKEWPVDADGVARVECYFDLANVPYSFSLFSPAFVVHGRSFKVNLKRGDEDMKPDYLGAFVFIDEGEVEPLPPAEVPLPLLRRTGSATPPPPVKPSLPSSPSPVHAAAPTASRRAFDFSPTAIAASPSPPLLAHADQELLSPTRAWREEPALTLHWKLRVSHGPAGVAAAGGTGPSVKSRDAAHAHGKCLDSKWLVSAFGPERPGDEAQSALGFANAVKVDAASGLGTGSGTAGSHRDRVPSEFVVVEFSARVG